MHSVICVTSFFTFCRWRNFDRNMFWLAVIVGNLILLHVLLLCILKLRKKNSEDQKGCGALTFPRFEIFLVILSLPCICEASAALIKGIFNLTISIQLTIFFTFGSIDCILGCSCTVVKMISLFICLIT